MVLVERGIEGEQPKCDRDCTAEATQGYTWAWGETGFCCPLHATLLQQTATQIERTIQFYPLTRPTPAPLTRDERTKLKAAALVLEEELEEAKSRGLELYRLNDLLRGETRLLKVREAEAAAQLKDAHGQLLELRTALQEREAENANLVMENERLQTLVAFSPSTPRSDTQPPGEPGEGETRVD